MSNQTPNKKKQFNDKNPVYVSDKDTPPYNDVVRIVTHPNTGRKESVLVKGITEDEKIAEGTRPPYQFQVEKLTVKELNPETGLQEERLIRTIGRFEKTKFEREELYGSDKVRGVHTNKPHSGKWIAINKNNGFKGTLIVHLKNPRRKEEYNKFKTTYSFPDVTSKDIFQVLNTIIKLNDSNKEDHVLNYIVKYYHLGKVHYGKAKA